MDEDVPACRPKTFLHGQAAAVGVAIFNGVGELSASLLCRLSAKIMTEQP